jgi:hypothetical protein
MYDMPKASNSGTGVLPSDVGVVCGENITLSTGAAGFLDVVSSTTLFGRDGTTFEDTSLDRLTRFVDIVNWFGIKKGLLTHETRVDLARYRSTIIRKVRDHFIDAESLPSDRRVLEPVFILEVRFLIELMLSNAR